MRSRILLADDSITIQKVVNLTFADEGIDVVSVSNGEMAEKRMGEVNPDLVLADIFMPGKNGYELCETIKKNPQFRNVPVVLLVGAFEPFDQGEAKRVKADGHLTKPFESRTLVETVRRLIQGAGARPRTGALPPVAPPQPEERADPLDTNPMTAEPFSLEHAGPDLAIEIGAPQLSETSPLELEYGAAPPPASEVAEPANPRPEHEIIGQFEGPFVRTTGALSSLSPAVVAFASDNGSTDVVGQPVAEAEPATNAPQVQEPAKPSGVPSHFGDQAGDLILDFDTNVEPEVPRPRYTASVETDESQMAKGYSAATEPQHEASSAETAAPFEPPVEAKFVEIDQPVETGTPIAAPAEPMQIDEAVANILGGAGSAREAELEASASSHQDPIPGSEADAVTAELQKPDHLEAVASEPAMEAESSLEQGVDAYSPLDVLMPPPVTPSDIETSDMQWGDQRPLQAEPTRSYSPKQDNVLATDHFRKRSESEAEAPRSSEDDFTASAMWAEQETRFTPIDIEATAIDESYEQSPAESNEVLSRADEPSFTQAASEVLDLEPPVGQQRYSGPTVSDVAAAQDDRAPSATAVSSAMIDEIVKRVVAELSDSVVREIAWEVVPDCVERVVNQMTRDGVSKRL